MILSQVVMEWSTIGIISTIVSLLVSGIVTLSNIFLRLYLSNQLLKQNETLKTHMDVTFLRKETADQKLEELEERIKALQKKLGQR